MESQPPGNVKASGDKAGGTAPANGVVQGTGGRGSAGGGVRRYPRPPGFIPRFVMLCLRPESWAEAARYPTYITLIPLVLAIVIGAVVISVGETTRLVHSLETFAGNYETKNHYPALELNSDGVLSAKGELNSPIRITLPTTPVAITVLIDPTHKTTPDTLKMPDTIFVTDKELVFMGPDGPFKRSKIADVLNNPLSEFKLPKVG